MIRQLRGTLVHRELDSAVVSCGGVGFLVTVPRSSRLPEVGGDLTLWTHLRLREDAADLFGFSTMEELRLFELMQKIRGFPAKAALAILSHYGVEGFRRVLAKGEARALTEVQGVGTKLAQQILLQLRGEIDLEALDDKTGTRKSHDDAELALIELGFPEAEAERRAKRARKDLGAAADTAAIVREALKG